MTRITRSSVSDRSGVFCECVVFYEGGYGGPIFPWR